VISANIAEKQNQKTIGLFYPILCISGSGTTIEKDNIINGIFVKSRSTSSEQPFAEGFSHTVALPIGNLP
jgi:hypothetical protein